MRKKDLKWLAIVARESNGTAGMYLGTRGDHLPQGPKDRLHNSGLIAYEFPDNPNHEIRWVITDKGISELEEKTR